MMWHLIQSKPIDAGARRWRTRLSAASVVVAVVVAAVWLMVNAPDGAAARSDSVAIDSGSGATFSRLSDIPSHNGAYRASMILARHDVSRNRATSWTVEVRTASGAPVGDAALSLESWMPDDDRVGTVWPRVTSYVGDGRYRIEGLRFDRHGWWNVRLQISAAGGTDSLAFNLIR
jgi:hypothetical protein